MLHPIEGDSWPAAVAAIGTTGPPVAGGPLPGAGDAVGFGIDPEGRPIAPAPGVVEAQAITRATRRAAATPVLRARPVEYRRYGRAGEQYGIGILEVPEVGSREPPGPIAAAQAGREGLVSLRADIGPIFDLRLGRAADAFAPEYMSITVVLDAGRRVLGVALASVSDAVRLASSRVTPAPASRGARQRASHLGLRVVDGNDHVRMLILVDIDELVADAPSAQADGSIV